MILTLEMRDIDHTETMALSFSAHTAREALDQTPWLRQVPAATLDRLAEQAVLHRVPKGSTLFEQSETPAFAQFLVDGRVDLIAVRGSNEAIVEVARPVDLLLPAAVLNRQPYLACARALEDVQLVLIHAQAFRDAVATDHALCLAVLACQAAQFRRQVKLARNLKLRSAEERVGCYLANLVAGVDPRAVVRLPSEKRHIAWQLGMTRETFSRILAGMTRYGLSVSGDAIETIDAEALRVHFQPDPLIDADEPIVPLLLLSGKTSM
jgi:CRP/FNR family transcriptional regulator, transcriptional activator FtrB